MAVHINLNMMVHECDNCVFYYYSDLRDVCILLKEEIPFEEAVNGIHPDCPFLEGIMRYEVYWNEREIAIWDTVNQSKIISTDEVTELQKTNCKIIAWMLNKNVKVFESV